MILTPTNSYLFDTTVFNGIMRRQPGARKIFEEVELYDISAGYSIFTEAELWAGIKKPRTPEECRLLLRPFKRYSINVTIAHLAGGFRRKLLEQNQQGPGMADCIIAATAYYNGLTVCTNNSRHFTLFRQFSVPVLIHQ